MGYSVAIRTLGTSGDKFIRELRSIYNQTILPDKVVVYIAEGYSRPSAQIGNEEYVWVKKGMVSQRALEYREIESDVILMLDDDVELALNSAELMLKAMEDNVADCIAADTFKNQEMTWREKLLAFLSNWVHARRDDGWAFKQNRDGSFSFNGNPQNSFCLTETFAGPCWMVKKSVLRAVHLEDELWLDRMGFSYGDDAVESYKFFQNGYKCGVLYDSGVKNLDAKTSSEAYHEGERKFYTRAYGMLATWWRMVFTSRDKRWLSAMMFGLKTWWQFNLHILLGVIKLDFKIPYNYIKGLKDGWNFVHSDEYKAIPLFNGYNKAKF